MARWGMASPPSPLNRAFAKALREARKSRGMTQEDFAVVSGRTYVSALERGLKSPTFEKLAELSDAIGIHPLTLLTLAYLRSRRGETVAALWTRVEHEITALAKAST